MDKAFHDSMTAGYALTEPGLVIGSPMLDGELANDARVQVALSMLNRVVEAFCESLPLPRSLATA